MSSAESDDLQHGSDTGVIDREGRFVPQAFEDMFAVVDKDGDGCLSLSDFWALIGRNKDVADFFGVGFLSVLMCFSGKESN
jgi:hypothetical protein